MYSTRPATTGLARPLERMQAKLAAGGTRLAIGVSTALEGVGRLSDGYREAYVAVQSIRPEGGVVCLEDLNPFEYLALRSDATPSGWCRRRSRTSWPRTPARAAP